MIDLNLNPPRRDLRIFAALLVPFFALVAFLLWRKGTIAGETAGWIVAAAVAAAAVGIAWPALIRWIYVPWMIAVFPIGWVMSYVMMGMVFYLIVTPIGLVLRLSGRDPLERKFDRQAKSYWQPRSQQKSTDRYFQQF